jgi:tetratricopeptide (TPR) repeat protein
MADLDYMVNNLDKDSAFAGEIFLYRGIVFALKKEDAKAIVDLKKSLAINPKQTNAYNTLANLYGRKNMKNEALEIITEGLRHLPEAKSLKRNYTELGGKLPYPEPILTKTTENTDKYNPAGKGGEKTSSNLPEAAQLTETSAHTTQAPSTSDVKQGDNKTIEAPKSDPSIHPKHEHVKSDDGGQKSWCRFCPD